MHGSDSQQVMPAGITNAYLFQLTNAVSWSLVLGMPLLLYLKTLGASATVLGVAVAIVPLLSVLQIPAAKYADRMGYREFVLRGWASRSLFILGIVVVAVLPACIGPRFRITMVVVMIGCFAAVRGISMCGYLPWITHLVPPSARGLFLSRDVTCMYAGVTGTMLLSAAWVRFFPGARSYGALFFLSWIAALASLVFIRRMPAVKPVESASSGGRPPWREMLMFPPFVRFVVFNFVMNIFVAALGILWITYMRDCYRASESLILGLTAYANVLGAVMSLRSGRMADRFGSLPLMAVACGLMILGQCFWMAMAAGALPRGTAVLIALVSFGSAGGAMFGLANTRLLMGIIPATGRSHFFALSNVISSLTLGLMPVLWGLILDTINRRMPEGMPLSGGWTWNAYSMMYAVIVAGMLLAHFFRGRLQEPRAMSTESFLRALLVESPARLIARALNPLRRPVPPG